MQPTIFREGRFLLESALGLCRTRDETIAKNGLVRTPRPTFEVAVKLIRLQTVFWMGCCVLLGSVWSGHSVIFYSTGDPSYNTNAPEGALTNSGWQYQGTWSSFDGTVISSNAFITAKHVGGSVGEPFTFQGVQYTTTASYESPDSDLRIWRVAGQFPVFAPLYTKRAENGKNIVVFGRGTQRGAEVRIN